MAVSAGTVANVKLLTIGSFLVLVSFLIETKQFPANGWALDFYDGVKPGFTGLTAAIGTTAVFFAFYKTLPVFPPALISLTVIIGISTFLFFKPSRHETNRT
jgi:formate hydrogenlyase subunit 3/multisubunit Na+/H+ antiporter MnhD subunit